MIPRCIYEADRRFRPKTTAKKLIREARSGALATLMAGSGALIAPWSMSRPRPTARRSC